MEIRRDFYLDKLIKRKNNGLIKVITDMVPKKVTLLCTSESLQVTHFI